MLLSDLLIELQDATYAQADEVAKLNKRFADARRGEHGTNIPHHHLGETISAIRAIANEMNNNIGAALRKERNAH